MSSPYTGRRWTFAVSAAAAAGHRRQDDQGVALGDRGVEAVEDANVLVVEIDVDVAVELAAVAEELAAGVGVGAGEGVEDLADVGAVGADLTLAADRRAQNG